MKARKHIMVHPNPVEAGLAPGTVVAVYELLDLTDAEFELHHVNPDSARLVEEAHAAAGDVIVETVDHTQEAR